MEIVSILQSIGFDWRVALANLANFLIIFYLLKRFAFPKISQALEQRETRIKEGLENARKAETELMMAEELKKTTLNQAKQEANALVSQAHDKGELIVAESKSRALVEAEKVTKEARAQIDKERKQAEAEFVRQSAPIIIAGAEKLIKAELDPKKGEHLIEGLLKK